MIALTKWPRLLMVGAKVKPEQANEIILRTDSWWMSSNDREWIDTVATLALHDLVAPGESVMSTGSYPTPRWELIEKLREQINALSLHYIHNSHIMSSWVGGPHGWCDWDGNVGTTSWNIGKWPRYEEVTSDWTEIAKAFPYLKLTSQLMTNEGEDNEYGKTEVAGQWDVAFGEVRFTEGPMEKLTEPDFDMSGWAVRFLSRHGERGVSIDRLTEALNQVKGH